MRIVVGDATVVDANGKRQVDVAVDDQTHMIAEVGEGLKGDDRISAPDCYLMPGFVDIHAHLRQPGAETSETVESGSRAAALGGFTGLVAMPNTNPCADSPMVVDQIAELSKTALCEVRSSAAITVGRSGKELAPIAKLFECGVRVFTDDGTGVQDAGLMRTAMIYAKGVAEANRQPITLAQHCEHCELSAGGYMHEGQWSASLGLGGQPRSAEEVMVARDIVLAEETGMGIHFQHLSTAGSIAMVRNAKDRGLPVTAEATPHHFTLTDEACKNYDTTFKVHPPLRTAEDVEAVIAGLRDGTIDAIATDHAPHELAKKDLPFDQAAPGMIGLETAFGLANTRLDLEIADLVRLMSTAPSKIGHMTDTQGQLIEPGAVANLTVVDPNSQWVVSKEGASMSSNNPFVGMTLTGKVVHTITKGRLVVRDGKALF